MGAITIDTVEAWLKRAREGLSEVIEAKAAAQESLMVNEKQIIAITAQIETLETLIDFDNNNQVIGLPEAGELVEELYDNRLEGPEGLEVEEVKGLRQDVYLREALESAEELHAANTEEIPGGEVAPLDT